MICIYFNNLEAYLAWKLVPTPTQPDLRGPGPQASHQQRAPPPNPLYFNRYGGLKSEDIEKN